jgi:hypothetical protein
VNPGSAGRKRFSLPRTCALVEILPQTLQARIVPLEDDSGGLPESLSVDRALRR